MPSSLSSKGLAIVSVKTSRGWSNCLSSAECSTPLTSACQAAQNHWETGKIRTLGLAGTRSLCRYTSSYVRERRGTARVTDIVPALHRVSALCCARNRLYASLMIAPFFLLTPSSLSLTNQLCMKCMCLQRGEPFLVLDVTSRCKTDMNYLHERSGTMTIIEAERFRDSLESYILLRRWYNYKSVAHHSAELLQLVTPSATLALLVLQIKNYLTTIRLGLGNT